MKNSKKRAPGPMVMARGDSLMCSRNPGSNYKSGLIAPKRILPTSVPTTRQQNNKSFMRCRSARPVENYNERLARMRALTA